MMGTINVTLALIIETYCSMEFFKEVHSPDLDIVHLKNLLAINSLTNLCASISTVTVHKENEGDIYCIWGSVQCQARRNKIWRPFLITQLPACTGMDHYI